VFNISVILVFTLHESQERVVWSAFERKHSFLRLQSIRSRTLTMPSENRHCVSPSDQDCSVATYAVFVEVGPDTVIWNGTPILEKGKSYGQRWYYSKERCYRLSIVTIALSQTIRLQCNLPWNVSDAQFNRRSCVTLGQNLGGKSDISKILPRSGRETGLSYAKEIVLISSAV